MKIKTDVSYEVEVFVGLGCAIYVDKINEMSWLRKCCLRTVA